MEGKGGRKGGLREEGKSLGVNGCRDAALLRAGRGAECQTAEKGLGRQGR